MGSYCALRFDERDVLSFKSSVREALISLFQETDRRETIDTSDPDEDGRIVTYSIGRRDLLERLDVLGATARAAADAFEKWRPRSCWRFASMQRTEAFPRPPWPHWRG